MTAHDIKNLVKSMSLGDRAYLSQIDQVLKTIGIDESKNRNVKGSRGRKHRVYSFVITDIERVGSFCVGSYNGEVKIKVWYRIPLQESIEPMTHFVNVNDYADSDADPLTGRPFAA
jgi:hypothetical protein